MLGSWGLGSQAGAIIHGLISPHFIGDFVDFVMFGTIITSAVAHFSYFPA